MPDANAFPAEGGCDCKRVRYRVEAAPLFVHCCHCRWCQRESGASFALNALIEADRVTDLGEPTEPIDTPSESGSGQVIARCPRCKIAVWSHYGGAGPLLKFIRVGTLDKPASLRPTSTSSPHLNSRGSNCRKARRRWSSTTIVTNTGLPKVWRGSKRFFRSFARIEQPKRVGGNFSVAPRTLTGNSMPALPSAHPKQFVQGAPVPHVPDVEAAAAFYRDVLGFTWDFGDKTYAVVWRDNSAIHFVRDERVPQGVHLFQWVKDVDSYYRELLDRGAQVATAPTDQRCETSMASESCSVRISTTDEDRRSNETRVKFVRTAVAAYGLLLLIVSGLGVARPSALIAFVERLWSSPYLAVLIRVGVDYAAQRRRIAHHRAMFSRLWSATAT